MLVVGVVVALVGLALFVGGGVLTWAYATQRDDAGYFATGFDRYQSAGYALTSTDVALETEPGDGAWTPDVGLDVRLRVRSPQDKPLFAGIGPTDAVARYLGGVAHDVIDEVRQDPFRVRYRPREGGAPSGPPAAETFWVASASGTGEQVLEWDVEDGRWSAVVMNADASRGVVVDADAGLKSWLVLPVSIGLVLAGFLGLALGLVLAIVAGRRLTLTGASATPGTPPTPRAA